MLLASLLAVHACWTDWQQVSAGAEEPVGIPCPGWSSAVHMIKAQIKNLKVLCLLHFCQHSWNGFTLKMTG